MLTVDQKQQIIKQNQTKESDTGSTVVQLALFSARIKDLQPHFQTHKKDLHSRRGLMAIVNKRRKLLTYLQRTDLKTYQALVKKII